MRASVSELMLYEAGPQRPRHPHPWTYKKMAFSDVLVSVLVRKFSKSVNLERHHLRPTSGLKSPRIRTSFGHTEAWHKVKILKLNCKIKF